MSTLLAVISAFAGLLLSSAAMAQAPHFTKPDLVLKQIVEGMPTGAKQEVSILTAGFKPGDQTVFHSHRFPVTVYVLEGAFTLEMEGRPAVTIKAGEAFVEPPNIKMTGFNRSTTEPIKVLIVYVGDPGTPFLDISH